MRLIERMSIYYFADCSPHPVLNEIRLNIYVTYTSRTGRGTDARTCRKTSTPLPPPDHGYRSYARDRRDYVASDMFAVLADTVEKKGVVCGFLGTVQYFAVLCVCAPEESLFCFYSYSGCATHRYVRNQSRQETIG